jgi:hypothetical protein
MATIQQHENTAPLTNYFLNRFHWHTATFKTIDWVSFSMAYSKFPCTRTFFHKLGWKQLPRGARIHRWSPSFDHQCPSCRQDSESDNHLFQYNHLLCKQWHKDLLNSIHDSFISFLDHDLFTIAKIGLQGFLIMYAHCLRNDSPVRRIPSTAGTH